ncbi:unnamed protein product [Leptidea sinapis]|uniref:Uncharacterized protein n=1 Tax=Leptidea sinapis TaxID=189913 RepID=A0A5E4QTU1_9NEOP|nr:unnamed protein product [Leptidea sinapis]
MFIHFPPTLQDGEVHYLRSSQPLDKLPVLEPVPSVAYFQVSKDAVPFTLRCSAPGRASGVKKTAKI